MDLDTCGRSYEQWDVEGCARSHDVMEQCEQCATWECDHWAAVERHS